ncbi:uncharacterized protein LACBIDRAFT_315346 [Laccaria bicolor S238N-H82]|uniref:Predicted protein n=1 Tax=Laccaria bicolor (strain S238N-H82 / ATCC MYA-4686) TaxID=486041 RepID=B0D266_LACBS|nr:uncharacterized protein LACBIDRAFT_315346 [Laccaria bicolor S238N-H82]EDR11050.1 predicted protein [Laccaria bicolor S238N-H82]|eukprot:XP_001878351.1 predicted protein [Laccaria bicolor S238N-H82]
MFLGIPFAAPAYVIPPVLGTDISCKGVPEIEAMTQGGRVSSLPLCSPSLVPPPLLTLLLITSGPKGLSC